MKELTCFEMLDSAKNTKRMHKIYFFSALNNAPAPLLQAISCRIKEKSGLNEEQCAEAQEICHRQWDQTLAQAEAYFDSNQSWKEILSPLCKGLNSQEKGHYYSLLKTLLLLSFEKASLNSLKNRMKERDLKESLNYLTSSETSIIRLAICSLFQRLIDHSTTPVKSDFIQTKLALIDLLARDLLDHLLNGSNKPQYGVDYLAFIPAPLPAIREVENRPALTLKINDQ